MTRKHFEAIAAVLRDAKSEAALGRVDGAEDMRQWIAEDLAREMRNFNLAFNPKRFLKAAGV